MDNKVNKNMFLLIKTYLIGPYWTIRNNYMVASSATISLNIFSALQRLKKHFEAIFALHTSYTLFGWLPDAPDYIVFIVIGCVRCLFCVKILC